MRERMRAWAKEQGCVGDRVRVCDAATCVIDSGAGLHGFAIREHLVWHVGYRDLAVGSVLGDWLVGAATARGLVCAVQLRAGLSVPQLRAGLCVLQLRAGLLVPQLRAGLCVRIVSD